MVDCPRSALSRLIASTRSDVTHAVVYMFTHMRKERPRCAFHISFHQILQPHSDNNHPLTHPKKKKNPSIAQPYRSQHPSTRRNNHHARLTVNNPAPNINSKTIKAPCAPARDRRPPFILTCHPTIETHSCQRRTVLWQTLVGALLSFLFPHVFSKLLTLF